MRPVYEAVIVLGWLGIAALSVTFLILFGNPNRYQDRLMSWHLALTTALAGSEALGYLVQGWSLAPAAAISVWSVSVMAWRVVLQVQARRAARERAKRRSQPSMEE